MSSRWSYGLTVTAMPQHSVLHPAPAMRVESHAEEAPSVSVAVRVNVTTVVVAAVTVTPGDAKLAFGL